MLDISYKCMCISIGLFIVSIFLYDIMKSNDISNKIIEGAEGGTTVSSDQIQKMNETETELSRMKTEQQSYINQITKLKSDIQRVKKKVDGKEAEIDKAINEQKDQANDASSGDVDCPS